MAAESILPRTEAPTSLLARLGLHRPELRAWALYDWANSVGGVLLAFVDVAEGPGRAREAEAALAGR